ncbi:FG-GAP-like repeat-containing protein [Cellulomonas sp. NS3]|uniref:FG-GAP-like repeat-containing protein n=1 Tax=Cellulomonas sp. NS3 TaxID=2973977 RepID=UPI002162E0D0|nr:FG-GAP-like repeat-containing protein [Cellulomonas sp. NS3]
MNARTQSAAPTSRIARGVQVGAVALALAAVGIPVAHAVQGPPPTPPVAAATVRLEIGGTHACSGSLVDAFWVVTAASCFTGPAGAPVTAGPPSQATTATIGRADLTATTGQVVAVDHVLPHPGRDLVLARLASPVTAVAPVRVATTPPAVGDALTIAGYGRTSTQIVPDTAHAATFTVSAVATDTLGIQAQSTGATICKGDAGGPALRTTATGALELVAIHHTAYQGGCLGQTTTQQGATETRLDNVRSWLTAGMSNVPLARLTADDWSGDGHADVLGVDVRGTLWYYPHDGNGLSPRTQLGTGWASFRHVVATDFSGDGHADVLGVDADGLMWYYPHNGGALSKRVQIGSGWQGFTHVSADDWNNDGRADVLGVDADGNLWLYVNVNGTLPSKVPLGSGWGSFRHVMAADYSGDGHADVVGVDADGQLWYYPHNGNGLTARVHIGQGWSPFKAVMASDWDRDGRADVLGVDATSRLWVYRNVNGTLPAKLEITGAPQVR